MLTQRVTLKQSIILAMVAVTLFLACCWSKTLVGFLIVVPLAIVLLGIPVIIAGRCQSFRHFLKPPIRHNE